MTLTHEQIFQRYVYAGAITRNPDAMADLFSEDGVYEAPLVPEGHRWPRRLAGREVIRAGIGAYHQDPPDDVKVEESRYVLHESADPDTFLVEIDAVANNVPVALVQIFRVRDGQITLLRDYFAAPDGV